MLRNVWIILRVMMVELQKHMSGRAEREKQEGAVGCGVLAWLEGIMAKCLVVSKGPPGP